MRCSVCGHIWEDALTLVFMEVGTAFGYEPNPVHFCPMCQSVDNEELIDHDDAGDEMQQWEV